MGESCQNYSAFNTGLKAYDLNEINNFIITAYIVCLFITCISLSIVNILQAYCKFKV